MENASKALIIAGAILLSILIISLGIMVYNNSKNTVGSANLSKQEIATFNSEWESYRGANKTAGEVSTMIGAVIASNAAERNNGGGRIIKINEVEPGAIPAQIPSTSTYIISLTYDNASGLVTGITTNPTLSIPAYTSGSETTTTPTTTP